ncbi:uncharacterized protein [Primulina eburnea]|uniref:uncharacterized protein n=1 Tax=Primulina eburnea TaxID=1245227 RepID=UPI003C6C4937
MGFTDRSSPVNLNSSEKQQHQQETMDKENAETHEVSSYEQFREERIKENLERMQKLGIFDLSLNFKYLKKPIKNRPINRKTPHSSSPLPSSAPVRRSSRLQNSTPVNYTEAPVTKKEESLEVYDLLREKGSKPEFYTDEDEKLLGSTEMSWTLFVDGYGKDGKRIYDPVRGKTCHQCRQKTLGQRTHCSECNMVQGQFCGDCLYMRYGENVLEAIQNPNWICPVCRGICNCSLCRQAKGWPPTGPLYRKISSLGYKSVAHFLMQTRCSNPDSDKTAGTRVPVSAKRSLPFSDFDATPQKYDLSQLDRESSGMINPQLTLKNDFPCTESVKDHKDLSISKPEALCSSDEQETCTNKNFVASKTSLKSSKKRAQLEPSIDSIGGRLRQRRRENLNNS